MKSAPSLSPSLSASSGESNAITNAAIVVARPSSSNGQGTKKRPDERFYDGEFTDGEEWMEDLLARTVLDKTGHTRKERDVITIYPGVPANCDTSLSSDATSCIHITRIAMKEKLKRLERDVEIAGKDAVEARMRGANESALVSMRRRKLALEESKRCAFVLSNLDTCELALIRAKDDVQIVQSLSLARDALHTIRESNGIDDGNGVPQMMKEIREEINKMDISHLEDACDEDELNGHVNPQTDKLEGRWEADKSIGHDSRLYQGEFRDGKYNGHCTFNYADGAVYVGEWKDGKMHGHGTFNYADESVYVGEWKDDMKHGHGTYNYADGAVYDGEWKENNRHGHCTLKKADGSVCAGEWKNGNKLGMLEP